MDLDFFMKDIIKIDQTWNQFFFVTRRTPKHEGAFTQSVLRRRLGYLINKKCFLLKKRPFYAAYSALV